MDKFKRFLPLLLFVVAFGYRLLGIGWGLPSETHHQSYHPDEEVIWNYSQAIEPGKLKFTPGFYNYGTLYLTTLRIATDMVGVYGGHMPQPEGQPPSSPTLTDWQFVGRSHMAGRVISAICGALIPVFVFLILRKRTNVLGASLGAMLPLLAPGLLVHSRFQTVDVMATALLVVSAWLALRFLEGEDLSDKTALKLAIGAGAFAGLSAGTKYTGFLAILTLIVALKLSKRADWSKLAGIGVASMFAAFFVATPGALLESSAFMRDVKFEMLHTSQGHGLIFEGLGSGFVVHGLNLIQVLGGIGLILAFFGVVACLANRDPQAEGSATIADKGWMFALLAFAIPYYILIGRAEVLFLRYTFPLVLVLACGLGWFAGWAHERKRGWMAIPVFTILALGQAASVGARMTGWMTGADPRDQAKLAIDKEVADTTTVGLVSDPWYYTPPFFPDTALSRMGVLDKGSPTPTAVYLFKQMAASQKPRVIQYLPPNARERYDWDVRLLTEQKPDYVVYSSFEADDVARLSDKPGLGEIPQLLVNRYKEFQAELSKSYAPLGRAGDVAARGFAHDLLYIQPTIYIWKRKG